MTTVRKITHYSGEIPDKTTQDPVDFSNNVGKYLDYFDAVFTPDSDDMVDDLTALAGEVENTAEIIKGYVNYKGDWASDITYALNESVSYTDGVNYVSKASGNINFQPDTSPGKWDKVVPGIGAVDEDSTPSLGGSLDGNGKTIYNTTVSTTTGLSLSVNASNILKSSLTADSSITFTGIPTGSTDWLVEISANGFTVTWDAAVVWDGDGTEPEWTDGTDTAYFYTTDGGTTVKGMRVRSGA